MIASVRKSCRGWTDLSISLVSSSSNVRSPLVQVSPLPPSLSFSLEKEAYFRAIKSLKQHMMLLASFSGQGDVCVPRSPQGTGHVTF